MNQLSLLTSAERSAVLSTIKILCEVFWGPTASLCEKLFNRKITEAFGLSDLSRIIASPESIEEINAFVSGFKDSEDLFDDLEATYVSTFISNRKGQIVPLYQSCYEFENAPIMGPPAIAMKKRFAEVGLSMESKIKEPPDHLCIEMEYLYFLCDRGWTEKDNSLLSKAASFSEHVMLPWVLEFQKKLVLHSDAFIYSKFASIMIADLRYITKFK